MGTFQKYIMYSVGLLLVVGLISWTVMKVNDSQARSAKADSQLAAVDKMMSDSDIKIHANTRKTGSSLLALRAGYTESNRRVNVYYTNIGGTGVIPLYIPATGAAAYPAPTGISAPNIPNNLALNTPAAGASSPVAPTTTQMQNWNTRGNRDYIDPQATYYFVVYTDIDRNEAVQILAIQQ